MNSTLTIKDKISFKLFILIYFLLYLKYNKNLSKKKGFSNETKHLQRFPDETSMEFPEITDRYILVRHTLNLKPSVIAEQSGLTKGYISKVESRKSSISLRLISFLCSTLHVNLNWLFTGNGSMFNLETNQTNEIESMVLSLENERKVMLQIIQNLSAQSTPPEQSSEKKDL